MGETKEAEVAGVMMRYQKGPHINGDYILWRTEIPGCKQGKS